MTIKSLFKKAAIAVSGLTLGLSILLTNGNATAQVACDPNGMPTSTTPVFNHFFNCPNGIGNEADFVRVKPKSGGNSSYVDTLNAACNSGDTYTVRTYVHNGADPRLNNNGSGSAVAHNVVVSMRAPLNTNSNSFTFRSTISASNAATVVDTGHLKCGNKNVKLTLVPSSVQTYSRPIGFHSAPDSAVNGSLKIGSRVQGSGDVWGCWEDRVIVTYDVRVEELPPVSEGECKALTLKPEANRRVLVSLAGEVNNATIVGYKIDFGDGTTVNQQEATHQYAQDGTYSIVGHVQIRFADGRTEFKTADACKTQVTFKEDKPPVVTPAAAPTPTRLPETGAGSVLAAFFGVSGISGALYYLVGRRLGL